MLKIIVFRYLKGKTETEKLEIITNIFWVCQSQRNLAKCVTCSASSGGYHISAHDEYIVPIEHCKSISFCVDIFTRIDNVRHSRGDLILRSETFSLFNIWDHQFS